MASEAGVLNLDPSTVVKKMRLQPGRMFLVDTAQGRIVSDEEIKAELAAEHPYQEWLDAGLFHLDELPQGNYVRMPHHRIVLRQQAFGYTYEELNLLVAPMARNGAEPLGSMGTDTPVAVLSQRPRMLFDYFQQLFAQVTNPPLDAIREEVVTSLQGAIGPEGDLLNPTAGLVPPDRAAAADSAQSRTGQADQPGPRPGGRRPQTRHAHQHRAVPVPGRRGRRRAAARA